MKGAYRWSVEKSLFGIIRRRAATMLYVRPWRHFLAAALEHEPNLVGSLRSRRRCCWRRRPICGGRMRGPWLVSASGKKWPRSKQIGQLGKEMYDRLAVAGEHLKAWVQASQARSAITINLSAAVEAATSWRTDANSAEAADRNRKKGSRSLPEIEALPRIVTAVTEKLCRR